MKIRYLKQLLIHSVDKERHHSAATNEEVLDRVIHGSEDHDVPGKEVTAYQVNGTIVFVSDVGLYQPQRVVFVDLKSGKSFLQQLE